MPNKRKLTYEEWIEEAKSLFGHPIDVAFKCPLCGHTATTREYLKVGTPMNRVGRECIGRWTNCRPGKDPPPTMGVVANGGPCDYTGFGRLKLNPVTVIFPSGKKIDVFEFGVKDQGD